MVIENPNFPSFFGHILIKILSFISFQIYMLILEIIKGIYVKNKITIHKKT